jgi:hypothetical protein
MLQTFFMCHPCASAFLLEKLSAQMYLLRLRISTLLSFGNGIITIDMHFFALFNGYFPLYPQILLRYTNGSLFPDAETNGNGNREPLVRSKLSVEISPSAAKLA